MSSIQPGSQTPTAFYPTNQPIMMAMAPMPFPSLQAAQYYIPQYHHSQHYVGPPQQYSVQPPGSGTFYTGPGQGEYPAPYHPLRYNPLASPFVPAPVPTASPPYYPGQTVYPPSPPIIVPTPQQPPPAKHEKNTIRIQHPNQGGRDITEEIMAGGSGQPSSTLTPPKFFQRFLMKTKRRTIPTNTPSIQPGSQTPTAVYPTNQPIMRAMAPVPFPSPQAAQYYIPQYHHSQPYVGPPQQYSVQPPGSGTFYTGPGPGEYPAPYHDAPKLQPVVQKSSSPGLVQPEAPVETPEANTPETEPTPPASEPELPLPASLSTPVNLPLTAANSSEGSASSHLSSVGEQKPSLAPPQPPNTDKPLLDAPRTLAALSVAAPKGLNGLAESGTELETAAHEPSLMPPAVLQPQASSPAYREASSETLPSDMRPQIPIAAVLAPMAPVAVVPVTLSSSPAPALPIMLPPGLLPLVQATTEADEPSKSIDTKDLVPGAGTEAQGGITDSKTESQHQALIRNSPTTDDAPKLQPVVQKSSSPGLVQPEAPVETPEANTPETEPTPPASEPELPLPASLSTPVNLPLTAANSSDRPSARESASSHLSSVGEQKPSLAPPQPPNTDKPLLDAPRTLAALSVAAPKALNGLAESGTELETAAHEPSLMPPAALQPQASSPAYREASSETLPSDMRPQVPIAAALAPMAPVAVVPVTLSSSPAPALPIMLPPGLLPLVQATTEADEPSKSIDTKDLVPKAGTEAQGGITDSKTESQHQALIRNSPTTVNQTASAIPKTWRKPNEGISAGDAPQKEDEDKPMSVDQPAGDQALQAAPLSNSPVPLATVFTSTPAPASSPEADGKLAAPEENGEAEMEPMRNGAGHTSETESSDSGATPGDKENSTGAPQDIEDLADPSGTRQYDRAFLLDFQFTPACTQKTEGHPVLPGVVLDQMNQNKLPSRVVDSRVISRGLDFTPASADFGRQKKKGRGAPKRLINIGVRGPPPRRIINLFMLDNVQLKKSKNAWKPSMKRKSLPAELESQRTQDKPMSVDQPAGDQALQAAPLSNSPVPLATVFTSTPAPASSPEADGKLAAPEENGEAEMEPIWNGAGHTSETESSDSGATPGDKENSTGAPQDIEDLADPSGTRQYDRALLLDFQFTPACTQKPEGHPVLPGVVLDQMNQNKLPSRVVDSRVISRGLDFTPASADFGRQKKKGRGAPKRLINIGVRGPPPRRIINLFMLDNVQLKKSKNAWKPSMKRKSLPAELESQRTQDLFTNVRSILNKLTPENFNQLMKPVTDWTIDTEERLKGVVDLVFEKAIDEASFPGAYGKMCRCLATLKVPTTDKPNNTVNFHKLLLNRCQKEFEKDKVDDVAFERKQKELDSAASTERDRLQVELQEAKDIARRRSIGNIKFISELFKLKMLSEAIMHDCVVKLLMNPDQESLECLCQLLTTIGKDLDFEKAKPQMDHYFNYLKKIVKHSKTSYPIRFMLQDIIDLRLHNWVSRRADQGPKTIAQIHQEAKIEEQEEKRRVQQLLLSNDTKRQPELSRTADLNQFSALQSPPSPQPSTTPPKNPDFDSRRTLGSRTSTDRECSETPLIDEAIEWKSQAITEEFLNKDFKEAVKCVEELDLGSQQKLFPSQADAPSSEATLTKRIWTPEELRRQLERLLLEDKASDEQIFDWVEENLDESQMSSSPFLRALMTAVGKAAVKDVNTTCRVDAALIQKRLPVLLKYLNSDTERQLQALYALQALIVTLDQPPNLLRMFFDCLCDEDVISEDAFYKWETSKDPAEKLGKGVALKSVTAFFTWLREAEEN